MRNVVDKLPLRVQEEAKILLRDKYNALSKEKAKERFEIYKDEFSEGYNGAVECLFRDKEQLLTFYDFPREEWRSTKTSNPIESSVDLGRLRTRAIRRIRIQRTALYLVFQLMMNAQRR